MSIVLQNLGTFFAYAVIAIFVQNAVFTRGFGVSRLTHLVSDSATNSMIFCGLLCVGNVISAPLGFFAQQLLAQPQHWYRDYVTPLAFVVCALIALLVMALIVLVFRPHNKEEWLDILPMVCLNNAILGPILITSGQNYDFLQTMGFALGSGIGYSIAVLIVSEGEHKMKNNNVPETFRGLPIKLLYVGILSLAIYALTGHRVAI